MLHYRVDTEVPKCQTTVQAISISIYVYIDILFACFGSFALQDFGINPHYLGSIEIPRSVIKSEANFLDIRFACFGSFAFW